MSLLLGTVNFKRAPEITECYPNGGGERSILDKWEAFQTHLVKEAVRTNAVSKRSPELFVQGNEILSH